MDIAPCPPRSAGPLPPPWRPAAVRPRACLPKALAALAIVFLGLGLAAMAGAVRANPAALEAALEEQVRALALEGTRQASQTLGIHRIDISVGQLDPRLRLAPCQQVQPYLPAGTRLWGKARIGLRCVQGPTPWNVYVPITVKVYAPALVVTSGLAPGAEITESDLMETEVDLAEATSPAVTDASIAVGRSVLRALLPGQSLREWHLKPRQWFAAGDVVKVVATGQGFAIAGQGQALTAGMEGQSARVRTETGRVLVGMPVADRLMELPL